VPIPDLSALVTACLQEGSEERLWAAMLCEDVVYRKIPEEKRPVAVKEAAEHGRRAAIETFQRFGSRDPIAISGDLGVQVVFSDEGHIFGKIVQTSIYTHDTRTITLYREALKEMNEFLSKNGLAELLGVDSVEPLYAAHELFHHLEEGAVGRGSDLLTIDTFKLGPFRLRSGVRQMSEIGADSYTQTLLCLPFAPRLLDYLTIWIHDEKAARHRIYALGMV
jgi:hypothetical protein